MPTDAGANLDANTRILFDADAAVAYNELHHDDRAGADPLRIAQLVHAWQVAHGLAADGKLGPATRASLDAAMLQPLPAPGDVGAPDYALIAAAALSGPRQAVVDRATAAAGERVYYDLGCGGSAKRPAWPPWDDQHKCDCSAFVCGALGFCRNAENYNTGKMVADACRFDRQRRRVLGKGPERRFVYRGMIAVPPTPKIAPPGAAAERAALAAAILELLPTIRPGDVIVHDGVYDPATGTRTRPGHVGIVVAVHLDRFDPEHPERWWFECVDVAHCSPTNSHAAGEPGHAIAITNAAAWGREAMFLVHKPIAAADATTTGA